MKNTTRSPNTHPLGKGTANLSINVWLPVRRALGRFAFLQDISMGELCRRLLAKGAAFFRASPQATIAAREDEAALQLLKQAVADGLQPRDIALIEQAERLIERSERHDIALARSVRM